MENRFVATYRQVAAVGFGVPDLDGNRSCGHLADTEGIDVTALFVLLGLLALIYSAAMFDKNYRRAYSIAFAVVVLGIGCERFKVERKNREPIQIETVNVDRLPAGEANHELAYQRVKHQHAETRGSL